MDGEIGENGNIVIIGHNYFDDRFFSNLNKLEIGDDIFLIDLKQNRFKYIVCDKYDIYASETENVIKATNEKELTLCTCTWNKNKRLIIKAKISENK